MNFAPQNRLSGARGSIVAMLAAMAVVLVFFLDAALHEVFGAGLLMYNTAETSLLLGMVVSMILFLYLFTRVLADRLHHPLQASLIPIIMHYLLGPLLIIGNSWYAFPYKRAGLNSEKSFHPAMFYSVLGLFFFILPIVVQTQKARAPTTPSAQDGLRQKPGLIWPIVALLCAMSLISTVMKINLIGGVGQVDTAFQNRRLATAGYGFLEIFSSAGYVAVIMSVWMFGGGKWPLRRYLYMILISTIAGMPFFFAGHRGGALYGYLLTWVTIFTIGRRSKLLPLAPLLIVCVLVTDHITGNMRLAYSTRGELFDWHALPERNEYPAGFRHCELLGCTIKLKDRLSHTPDTVVPSFTNWVPRALNPDKPLTTGPTLAGYLAPEWFTRSGKHTSSLTTGPMVELYYNFGPAGLCVGMFLLGIIFNLVARWYENSSRGLLATVIFVGQMYLLGWKIWVDDLGGFINKEVCYLAVVGLVALILANVKKAPSRLSS